MCFPIKPPGWKPGDTAAKDGCRYGAVCGMRLLSFGQFVPKLVGKSTKAVLPTRQYPDESSS
jgi:hypothetical protein